MAESGLRIREEGVEFEAISLREVGAELARNRWVAREPSQLLL
jgi:hypothetical protein